MPAFSHVAAVTYNYVIDRASKVKEKERIQCQWIASRLRKKKNNNNNKKKKKEEKKKTENKVGESLM